MRTLLQPATRWAERRLSLLVLLCVTMLFGASTAQACHVHERALKTQDGKAWVSAPVDECPLCAATHAALPIPEQTVAGLVPETALVAPSRAESAHVERWSYELFSRPPPALESFSER